MALELLSQKDVAELCKVDRLTVRYWTHKMGLKPFQVVAGRPIFEKQAVLDFDRERLARKESRIQAKEQAA